LPLASIRLTGDSDRPACSLDHLNVSDDPSAYSRERAYAATATTRAPASALERLGGSSGRPCASPCARHLPRAAAPCTPTAVLASGAQGRPRGRRHAPNTPDSAQIAEASNPGDAHAA